MNAMQKNQAQVSRADDRSDDMVPLTRMYNSATPVKKYSPIMKLKEVPADNKGLAKLPEEVRNNMGFQRKNKFCGGMSKPYGKKK
jgi:hypothetical protein